MTTNPLTAEDPTTRAEYVGGRWQPAGRYTTTRGVTEATNRLTAAVDRIRGQRSLSDEAKRIAVARAYREARDAINSMRQAETDRIEGARAKLSRQLFGHVGEADAQTVIIRRDAADRAAKLTNRVDAERALKLAETNGDSHMAQAIAAHAQAHMWPEVVSTYLTSRPQAGAAAEELSSLPDTADPGWRMGQAITYSLMRPSELEGISEYQVDALADTVLDG
ncbi:hypothetical protein ACFWC2_29310 [Streptomyces diastaticus]